VVRHSNAASRAGHRTFGQSFGQDGRAVLADRVFASSPGAR
jgi:hypothetical protein